MKLHDEIDDWMAAALCGALTPDEQKNFDRHLAECPQCRSLYEETQKMNDILNHTLPELRPDGNFERRVIAGFREKIAGSGFHPWRALIWLVQFRSMQAAMALLLLAAMMKGGSMITGERAPWSTPAGSKAFESNVNESMIARLTQTGVVHKTKMPVLGDLPVMGALFRGKAQNGFGGFDHDKNGVDLLSAPSVTTKSGDRYTVVISGDTGVAFDSDYSRDMERKDAQLVPRSVSGASSDVTLSNNFAGINTYSGTSTATFGSVAISKDGKQEASRDEQEKRVVRGKTAVPGGQITSGLRSGSEAISGNAIDALLSGTSGKHAQSQISQVTIESKFVELKSDDVKALSFDTAPVDARKLIRNASLEFEIPNFEKAVDTIGKVAQEEESYIFTQNSERGGNGKLQGVIVVKVLPANLDRFLLKLRALGDLKNQAIGTEDVTKAYFDTAARMRNAQQMEERLLDMLKKTSGKVTDLLQVEREIARVRGEIEEMQGQLKVYDAQVQYATVTISLSEKDINQTAAYLLKEHAQLSLFTKDVEKAFAEAKGDAETAKAQTIDSHIERNGDGRIVATLHLLLPPESSEEAIARLKAIGRIQNFTSQTERVARDGSADSDTAKVERDKVELNLIIQRDAENAVQGTNIGVLTDKVEEQTAAIKQAAAAAGVEVKGAEFNREQNGVEVSSLLLRMPVKKYAAFLEQIKSLGKVKNFTVTRHEDASTASDDAPAEIALQIYSQGNIVADETGLWPTIRHTLGEGFAALMWSVRMIGVSLAFAAPWAVALGLILWLIVRRRRISSK